MKRLKLSDSIAVNAIENQAFHLKNHGFYDKVCRFYLC